MHTQYSQSRMDTPKRRNNRTNGALTLGPTTNHCQLSRVINILTRRPQKRVHCTSTHIHAHIQRHSAKMATQPDMSIDRIDRAVIARMTTATSRWPTYFRLATVRCDARTEVSISRHSHTVTRDNTLANGESADRRTQ